MSQLELQESLVQIARKCVADGPGFAQETVVLRDAAEQLQLRGNLLEQQRLLTAWHELFRAGKLSWGYDIDNPGPPFFHFPEQ